MFLSPRLARYGWDTARWPILKFIGIWEGGGRLIKGLQTSIKRFASHEMSTQGSYQNANLFKKSHVQYTHTQSQSIQQAAVALAEISMTFTTQKYMKRFILRVREHGWLQRGLPLTAKDTMSQPKSGNFEMPLDIWKFGSSLVSRDVCIPPEYRRLILYLCDACSWQTFSLLVKSPENVILPCAKRYCSYTWIILVPLKVK